MEVGESIGWQPDLLRQYREAYGCRQDDVAAGAFFPMTRTNPSLIWTKSRKTGTSQEVDRKECSQTSDRPKGYSQL
jgi:hypothetical protein